MTMYDVTSGFNIGANISIKKEFNSMVVNENNESCE